MVPTDRDKGLAHFTWLLMHAGRPRRRRAAERATRPLSEPLVNACSMERVPALRQPPELVAVRVTGGKKAIGPGL
jgi:hypothetical protein